MHIRPYDLRIQVHAAHWTGQLPVVDDNDCSSTSTAVDGHRGCRQHDGRSEEDSGVGGDVAGRPVRQDARAVRDRFPPGPGSSLTSVVADVLDDL